MRTLFLFIILCAFTRTYGQDEIYTDMYFDSLVGVMNSLPEDTSKIRILDKIANEHENPDTVLKYAEMQKEISIKLNDTKNKLTALEYIAWAQYSNTDYIESIETSVEGYNLSGALKEYHDQALFCLKIANSYTMMTENTKAIFWYEEGIKIAEHTHDDNILCQILLSMGIENAETYAFDAAHSCITKAKEIAIKIEKKDYESRSHHYLAILYYNMSLEDTSYLSKSIDEDLISYNIAKEHPEAASNIADVATTLPATVFKQIEAEKLTGKAKDKMLDLCYKILVEGLNSTQNQYTLPNISISIAEYHIAKGEHGKAKNILDSLNNHIDINDQDNPLAKELAFQYYNYYNERKDYKNALEYLCIVQNYNETNNSTQYAANASRLMANYDYEKKLQEQELVNEREKVKMETEAKYRNVVIILLLALGTIITVYLIKSKRTNIRLNEQNKKLEEQQEEILIQSDAIKRANTEIIGSMNYARLIQSAAMPTTEQMRNIWKEHAVIFRPLNIVSGDFYWTSCIGGYKILAVGDCTGHGVPGGLLSMLGISLLDDTITAANIRDISAAEILNKMRDKLQNSLHQSDETGSNQDGMDIALAIVDTEKHEIRYSGAYRPLLLVSKNVVNKYDPDRMPIGISTRKGEFTQQVIPYKDDDTLYLFSDGITDQFGYDSSLSKQSVKYSIHRLMESLHAISDKSLKAQKVLLEEGFKEWTDDNNGLRCEQIDDMIMVGVRL